MRLWSLHQGPGRIRRDRRDTDPSFLCPTLGREHDSSTTPAVRRRRLPFRLSPSGPFASERLTKPYSGELPASAALSQPAHIARLPNPPTLCPHWPPVRFPLLWPTSMRTPVLCHKTDDTCARNVSCVGDGSPALRYTGIRRGEARASQVTRPSSSCLLWSNTPPHTDPSSPHLRRDRYCLR